MRRCKFITLRGTMPAAWPLSACTQQAERVRRIGMISGANDQLTQARIAAFRELQQLCWTEGRNVRIDARWSAGNAAEIRRYAAEFVALAPDVISLAVTVGGFTDHQALMVDAWLHPADIIAHDEEYAGL